MSGRLETLPLDTGCPAGASCALPLVWRTLEWESFGASFKVSLRATPLLLSRVRRATTTTTGSRKKPGKNNSAVDGNGCAAGGGV